MAFCSGCGAAIPDDEGRCPTCGLPVEDEWDRWGRGRFSPWGDRSGFWWPPASRQNWQKRWGWMWSPAWILVNAVLLGLFIIFLGVVLFLAASAITPLVTWANFWAYLFIGLGVLFISRGYARMVFSGRRLRWYGSVISGLFFIIVGIAALVLLGAGMMRYAWTLFLVLVGVLVIAVGLANYLFMKRK